MIPILKTERLTLRPFGESDAVQVEEWLQDKRISDTTLRIPYPYPKGEALDWIQSHPEKIASMSSLPFAITLSENNRHIGTIGLMPDMGNNQAELGYWMAVPFWNKGLMTEAVNAVIDWGFKELNLRRISAQCFSGNLASAKVMQKAGMQFEGTMRAGVRKNSEYLDLETYAILEGDKKEMQEKTKPILETNRLRLRIWELKDAQVFSWLSNIPDIADGTLTYVYPQPKGWGEARIKRSLDNFVAGIAYPFAITRKDTGEIIGDVGLWLESRHKRGEIGYWLGENFRGQGFVTEAVEAVLEWGFETLELRRVQAGHFPRNPASGRVLERAGMSCEGLLRAYVHKESTNTFEDVLMYAKIRGA